MQPSELKQIADELRRMADRIEVALSESVEIPDAVRESVAQAMAERKCLQCRKRIAQSKRYIRGLCHADYQKTYRWIKDGIVKEADLLVAGKIAEESSSGRPMSKRDRDMLAEVAGIAGEDLPTKPTTHPAQNAQQKKQKGTRQT